MKEIYKDVKNFEGYYKISNLGNVKSLGAYNNRKEKLLTQEDSKSKNTTYKRVKLHKDGFTKRYLVHRLVALHFLENPDNKPQVNHIDNDPSNNNVLNLEWCTGSENMKHSKDQGRQDKVTAIASKAMAKANKAKSKLKYDSFINQNLNGRILISYYAYRKPSGANTYKGIFKCVNCDKEFTAELDAAVRNINKTKSCFCVSCSKKG